MSRSWVLIRSSQNEISFSNHLQKILQLYTLDTYWLWILTKPYQTIYLETKCLNFSQFSEYLPNFRIFTKFQNFIRNFYKNFCLQWFLVLQTCICNTLIVYFSFSDFPNYFPDLPTWPTYLTYQPNLPTGPTFLTFCLFLIFKIFKKKIKFTYFK